MEANTVEKKTKPVINLKPSGFAAIRIKKETRKRILTDLAKINKKDFGRRVRIDQLMNVLLSLLRPEHIQKLQEDSLSNSDRLEMLYREHIKRHGVISKDEFLGRFLSPDAAKTISENAAVSEEKR